MAAGVFELDDAAPVVRFDSFSTRKRTGPPPPSKCGSESSRVVANEDDADAAVAEIYRRLRMEAGGEPGGARRHTLQDIADARALASDVAGASSGRERRRHVREKAIRLGARPGHEVSCMPSKLRMAILKKETERARKAAAAARESGVVISRSAALTRRKRKQ